MPDGRSLLHSDHGALRSTPFELMDRPPGWPNPRTAGSSILSPGGQPPLKIQVAFHRDSRTIWKIVPSDSLPMQDRYWLTVPYDLYSYTEGLKAVYAVEGEYALTWDGHDA